MEGVEVFEEEQENIKQLIRDTSTTCPLSKIIP